MTDENMSKNNAIKEEISENNLKNDSLNEQLETDEEKNNNKIKDSENEIKNEQDENIHQEDNIINDIKIDYKEMYLELLKKYDEKEKEASDYFNMLKRTMADFDNFRKRTNKEKESIYDDGVIDAVRNVLPVLDNLERALEYNNENESLIEGIKMVVKLFKDILTKMQIEELNALGEKFNPEFHNAVMHIEDEKFGENEVIEVLQKGYKYKDKILRYSMVKVAN